MQESGGLVKGIIHLWSLDLATDDVLSPASFDQIHLQGPESILSLVQALTRIDQDQPARLCWLPGTLSVLGTARFIRDKPQYGGWARS